MHTIDDKVAYDSFEEISNACPIGLEKQEIVKYKNYTWDDEEDSGYTEYCEITVCVGYIYDGDCWKPLYNTTVKQAH